MDQSESLKNKVGSAREMLSVRKKLWEEYAQWLYTKKQMMDNNVLRGITIVASELQDALDRFAVAIERMEELHVDDNELNVCHRPRRPFTVAMSSSFMHIFSGWLSWHVTIDLFHRSDAQHRPRQQLLTRLPLWAGSTTCSPVGAPTS